MFTITSSEDIKTQINTSADEVAVETHTGSTSLLRSNKETIKSSSNVNNHYNPMWKIIWSIKAPTSVVEALSGRKCLVQTKQMAIFT